MGCPVSLKYCLASFQAVSTASPPPVVKKIRFRSPGARCLKTKARKKRSISELYCVAAPPSCSEPQKEDVDDDADGSYDDEEKNDDGSYDNEEKNDDDDSSVDDSVSGDRGGDLGGDRGTAPVDNESGDSNGGDRDGLFNVGDVGDNNSDDRINVEVDVVSVGVVVVVVEVIGGEDDEVDVEEDGSKNDVSESVLSLYLCDCQAGVCLIHVSVILSPRL